MRGVSTTGLRSISSPTTGHATRGTTGLRSSSTLNILGGKGAHAQIPTSRPQTADSFLPRSSVPKQSNTLGASLPGVKASSETASKGGGEFRPIGTNGQASFNVPPANGALKVSMPIHTSPARGGFGPELQPAYDPGAGNGPFGIDDDEFTLGGTDLVPRLKGDQFDVQCVGEFRITKYRPRVDPQAMRIEKWTRIADNSDVHWRTISADNVTSIYGKTDESRIMDSTGHKRVFSWLLTRTFDALGNAVSYIYKPEDGVSIFPSGIMPIWEQNHSQDERFRQRYLKRIRYGNLTPARDLDTWKPLPVEDGPGLNWMFEVVLDYGEHHASDPFSTANAGFKVRTYRLCPRLLMFHHLPEEPDYPDEVLVSSTSLTYKESGQGTFLSSATASGYAVAEADKERRIAISYTFESLPPSTFTYTMPPDLRQTKALRANIANLADMPRPGSLAEWLDLDGDGIPGLLTRSSDGTLSYQRNNRNQTFSAPEILGQRPAGYRPPRAIQRSGPEWSTQYCMCRWKWTAPKLLRERESDSDTWSEYSEFPQTPVSEPQQQGISIDLTGQGTPDLLLQQGDVEHELIWQQSLGKQGMSSHRRTSGLNTSPEN
ncbi:hypothetical protein IFM51744_09410 [Aspergillus udagawae]|nr:hypothetical protein IFM51744_09410 [Aspergillus udagawae]